MVCSPADLALSYWYILVSFLIPREEDSTSGTCVLLHELLCLFCRVKCYLELFGGIIGVVLKKVMIYDGNSALTDLCFYVLD